MSCYSGNNLKWLPGGLRSSASRPHTQKHIPPSLVIVQIIYMA